MSDVYKALADPTRRAILDDGTGASPGHAGTNGQDGQGISGMRERALALSGQLTAGPHPDGGFQVWCTLPT